jgi:hypothetical protein
MYTAPLASPFFCSVCDAPLSPYTRTMKLIGRAMRQMVFASGAAENHFTPQLLRKPEPKTATHNSHHHGMLPSFCGFGGLTDRPAPTEMVPHNVGQRAERSEV